MGRGELVVRVDEVVAAALDVDGLAEEVEGDAGALDVPAGAAAAHGRIPGGLAFAGGDPQDRVERVALAFAVGVAAAFAGVAEHGLAVVVRLGAELGVGLDGVVDVAGLVAVGRAGLEQAGDRPADGGDGFDRADEVTGRDDAEGGHVLAVEGGLAQAEDLPVGAVAFGAFEQGLVDVGDVLGVVDVQALVEPVAVHQVEGDHRGGVPEVGGIVGGDAADVHRGALAAGLDRLEQARRGGVVQAQGRALAGQGGYVGAVQESMTAIILREPAERPVARKRRLVPQGLSLSAPVAFMRRSLDVTCGSWNADHLDAAASKSPR